MLISQPNERISSNELMDLIKEKKEFNISKVGLKFILVFLNSFSLFAKVFKEIDFTNNEDDSTVDLKSCIVNICLIIN